MDKRQSIDKSSKIDTSNGERRILTIPNMLSMLRLAMIPFIIWLYLKCKRYDLALVLLLLSGLSDTVDGWIARRFNMVTDVGKVLDPIADKLTQASMILCLAITSLEMRWLFCILIVKELIMGVMGLVVLKKTGKVNSAKWYGKLCTWILYATVMAYLVFPNMPKLVAYTLSGVSAASIILSLIGYMLRYAVILRTAGGKTPLPRLRIDWRVIVAALLLIAAFVCINVFDISVNSIITFTPDNTALAVIVMLLLYAFKSVTFIISLRILQLACGIMFSLPVAITVNIIGSAITIVLPYLLGRWKGKKYLGKLLSKYPNLEKLISFNDSNAFMASLCVRGIGLTALDPTSLYFGAAGTPFIQYFSGSMLGLLPTLIVRTAMGVSAEDPSSIGFKISVIAYAVVIIAVIALGWSTWKKFSAKKQDLS